MHLFFESNTSAKTTPLAKTPRRWLLAGVNNAERRVAQQVSAKLHLAIVCNSVDNLVILKIDWLSLRISSLAVRELNIV